MPWSTAGLQPYCGMVIPTSVGIQIYTYIYRNPVLWDDPICLHVTTDGKFVRKHPVFEGHLGQTHPIVGYIPHTYPKPLHISIFNPTYS